MGYFTGKLRCLTTSSSRFVGTEVAGERPRRAWPAAGFVNAILTPISGQKFSCDHLGPGPPHLVFFKQFKRSIQSSDVLSSVGTYCVLTMLLSLKALTHA